MINQTIKNRYKVTAELGRGAMGLVYRATDRQTRQEVAIKVIAANLALDANMLARFRREGEALRQLRHRNIVAFVEMFEHQGQQVIVMEYVPGGNLAGLIRRGPLPPAEVVRITLELCDALAQAHHIDIIHRDIKPENVLLTPEGVPKLTDFGIARLLGETTNLTHTGTVLGTPCYMSPEAWQSRPLDAQADVWSLGVMVYQMASGQLPFAGDTLPAVMNKVLTEAPPDLRALRPGTPEALVQIIERMLRRDKGERYRTMRQVAVDLEEIDEEARRQRGEANRKIEEARRKQAEETRREQEARLKAETEQKALAQAAAEARRKAEEEQKARALREQSEARQAQEARRKAEEEQKARARQAQEEARRAEEEARLERQYATRLPEDYVPTEVIESETSGAAPTQTRAKSWRVLALIGVGVLIVVCLLAGGGALALKMLGPATPTAPRAQADAAQTALAFADLATQTARTGASQTALAIAAAPFLTPTASWTPEPPTVTSTPRPPTDTPSPTFTAIPALGIGSTQVSAVDGMVQVYVPAGDFLMGSTDSDSQANSDEKPQHTVRLDAFWIDQTDVTNAMYAQCVQAGKCQPPSNRSSNTRSSYYGNSQYDRYPVINVSWNDATAYCAWAGRRLPTEAEWEKAARGTDGRLYPWGNQAPSPTLANFNQNVGDTTEVGKYQAGASPYGALDMAGNVWEWVNDWYDANYYSTSPTNNPPGPATGTFRVLRGGSWYLNANDLRAAYRYNYHGDPSIQGGNVGFRCGAPPGK